MGNITFSNIPYTVDQFTNANAIMGKMTVCVCLDVSPYVCTSVHVHVSAYLPQCVWVFQCACDCAYKEETLLQTVQIYLYANWISVKRFGMPHGLSSLVKWG